MSELKDGCPFCDRIDEGQFGRLQLKTVCNFAPLNPITDGHMLFTPMRHIEHKYQVSALHVGECMEEAARWGRMRDEDFNLIISRGPSATQTVNHIHVHYIPRRENDGLHLPWTEQKH